MRLTCKGKPFLFSGFGPITTTGINTKRLNPHKHCKPNKNTDMIRIAIQAKGRLNEESIALLKEAGISIEDSKRKLLAKSDDFPIEVLYLRDDDIPQAVAMGVADLATP